MKKVLLMLILTAIGFVWAQEDWYVAENDEHSSDVTATEIISSEPLIITALIGENGPEGSDATPEKDMTASAEMSYSEYSKKINVPFWYRWREYSFNLTVPYFIAKEVDFGMDTKYSVSGIGDITLGTSYGKYLEQYNTYIDGNLSVKMPTGDPEAEDDGNVIPLGSDTWDFALALSGFYFMEEFTFKS
ncbi:MAG TPA: transporter, partial [Clostridiales bacterium]|nr:transporter [Clostridiales bacterium]